MAAGGGSPADLTLSRSAGVFRARPRSLFGPASWLGCRLGVAGPAGRAVTAQGHPRTRFRRAIEGRGVFHAELAAWEPESEARRGARALCLYAEAEPAKFERAAVAGWAVSSPSRSRRCCASRWP
jgi:hypothetical protein